MKFLLAIIFSIVILGQPLNAGEYAQEANDNPFLNGELNSKFRGEVTAIAGEILDIKPTKQNYPLQTKLESKRCKEYLGYKNCTSAGRRYKNWRHDHIQRVYIYHFRH